MSKVITSFIILTFFTLGLVPILFPAFAASYTITVNGGTRTGRWNRFYERAVASDHMYTIISSAYGRNICNAMRKGHDEAGFQYIRGHGILDADVNVYTETTGGIAVYNWTNFDKIYDSIITAGMKPIVEIGFMPPALAAAPVSGVTGSTINNVWYNGVGGNWCAPKDWTKWESLVKALIVHVEGRYGAAEVRNNWFFELWNEPNWMYGGGGGLEGYKTLYNHTSAAVRAQDALIRLGGPAESGGSTSCCLSGFLSYCKTNNCKLDFVSYHNYANDGSTKDCDPTDMLAFYKSGVVDVCKANSFSGLILNTEWGPSYTAGVPLAHDNEMAASFAVKTIHMLNLNDTTTYPPPYSFGWWAISDIYEEIDNRGASPAFSGCYGLLCRGVSTIPQSWDVAKPAFNAFKLMHRLKDNRIGCTGGTTASPGVNAIATISSANDTISVLVYSHVNGTGGNPATTDNVTLNITTPAGWTNARAEHWVVDHGHSNAYQTWVGLGSPANPSADQWTAINNASQLAHYDSVATIVIAGNSYNKTFTVNYYSVGLIQLTKATTGIPDRTVKRGNPSGTVRARLAGNAINVDVGITGRYVLSVYSADGRRVAVKQGDGPGLNAIPFRTMAAGVYFLEYAGQRGTEFRNIVVNHGN
jgi:xylan 1,4-beta-xylosidase